MKSKIRKRLLAVMLCLAMVLNGNVSLLANDDVTTDEQVAAESVEEIIEEVTEEVTEEVAEETAAEVEEEAEEVVEEIANDVADDSLILKTELNGTIITMSGPKSSFPEGTDYSVSASELSEEALSDVEASLRKVELETEEKIASYKAYDIKLIVDGKENQPLGKVNVTFQGQEVKEQVANAENVEVYHVDESKQVAVEVEGEATSKEVVMTTDHFSTYVITTTQAEVEVTIQHYLTPNRPTDEKVKLYADDTYKIAANQTIEEIAVATNYNVDSVFKVDARGNHISDSLEEGTYVVDENTIYRVYYSPTEETVNYDIQMFDYQVKPTGQKTVNDASNYPANSKTNARVTMGKNSQNTGTPASYKPMINGKNVNDFTGSNAVLEGIITGIDYATGELKMGRCSEGLMYEPGFFTKTEIDGKQELSGYSLNFKRTGDTYKLVSALDPNNKVVATAGSNFWPLNDIVGEYSDNANTKTSGGKKINFFFGFRYDIEFTIGDYVGPLSYTFEGDDDMWVVLDSRESSTGGNVIVDIGGIHQSHKKTVDIWKALGLDPENPIPEEEKNKVHTLTILYLERGGEESNCNMEFTLPNSKVITPTQNPVSFQFDKVDSQGNKLAGATFGLYNTSDTLLKSVESTNGVVKFDNLFDGIYYVKEISAPEGYLNNSTVYKLTIINGIGKLVAVNTETELTEIVNYTKAESIQRNKTASIVTADDVHRTYKIDLTASTLNGVDGVQTDSIVDVIDSRFTLLNGTELQSKYPGCVQIIPDSSTGLTTIIWTGEAAYITNEWHEELIIQTKADFIGGNMIPTNTPNSGITVGDVWIPFPQPSVNVELLDFEVFDQEITVFKGEVLNTTEFAKVLADSLRVIKQYSNVDDRFKVLPETGLTKEQLDELNANKVLDIPYAYEGTGDYVGKFRFEYILDPVITGQETTPGTEVIEDGHAELVTATPAEIYRLTVSYIPYSVQEREQLLVDTNINQPTEQGGRQVLTGDLQQPKNADYIVNVISGEIQITKTLKTPANGPKTFTFKVEGESFEKEIIITVPEGALTASYEGDELKDLAKGTYVVTENEIKGYAVETVSVGEGTNCQYTVDDTELNESISFTLGTGLTADDMGTLGVASFTNEVAYKDWSIIKRSSTSTEDNLIPLNGAEFELKSSTNTYIGKSEKVGDTDGVVVWYRQNADGTLTKLENSEYIASGTYTLTETKAPAGYSLSNEEWEIVIVAGGSIKSFKEVNKGDLSAIVSEDGELMYYIDNTPLYELPHSGGLGIYTYTIGGILLMAFATLILYKNRRKEVLARY